MRNPSLKDLGPSDALQIRCCQCRKIVMLARTRDELIPELAVHYVEQHDHDSGVLLEGEHFVIEKAPPARCDLCGVPAERPFWVWITPPASDYDVDDPEWCVCDSCDPLVRRSDVIGLCKRVWEVGSAEFVVKDAGVRKADIRDVVVAFLNHVDPNQTYRDEA